MINRQIILRDMSALASSLLAQLTQDGNPAATVNPIVDANNVSASMLVNKGKSSVPNGRGLIRYRAPDMDTFIFDQKTGYRFDSTTGLRYDANSGFFINTDLQILLRWDPESSTYMKVADLSSLVSKQPQNQLATQHKGYNNRVQRSASGESHRQQIRYVDDLEASRSRSSSRGYRSEYSGRIYSGIRRRRSPSNSELSTGEQSRRRSVSRERKRYRSQFSEAKRSNVAFRRTRSPSRSPHRHQEGYSIDHTLRNCQQHRGRSRSGSPILNCNYSGRIYRSRSRSQSPSSFEQSAERYSNRNSDGRKRYRSNSREARRSNVAFRRNGSQPQSARLQTNSNNKGPTGTNPLLIAQEITNQERRNRSYGRSSRGRSISPVKQSGYSDWRRSGTSMRRSPSHPADRQRIKRSREKLCSRSHSREKRKGHSGVCHFQSQIPHQHQKDDAHNDTKQYYETIASESPENRVSVWNRLGPCSILSKKRKATNPAGPLNDIHSAMTGYENQSKGGSDWKKSPLPLLDDEYVVLDECQENLDDISMTADELPAFEETPAPEKSGKDPKNISDVHVFSDEYHETGDGKKSPLPLLDDEYVVLDECQENLDAKSMTVSDMPAFEETPAPEKPRKDPKNVNDEHVFLDEYHEIGDRKKSPLPFLDDEYVVLDECQENLDDISMTANDMPAFEETPAPEKSRKDPKNVNDEHVFSDEYREIGDRKKSPLPVLDDEYVILDECQENLDDKSMTTSDMPAFEETPVPDKSGKDPENINDEYLFLDEYHETGDGKKSPLPVLDDEYVVLDECQENLDDKSMTADELPPFEETPASERAHKEPVNINHEPLVVDEYHGTGDRKRAPLSLHNDKCVVLDECRETLDSESTRAPESAAKEPQDKYDEHVVLNDDQETREDESMLTNDASAPEEAQASKTKIVDMGDVLGHLFADHSSITNILLVAPVPLQANSNSEKDALKKQIGNPEDIFKLYVNHKNTSGMPCHFLVVSFKRAIAAKKWYDSLQGTILLSGEDGSKMKGYLHFMKKGNWNCKHCKSFNLFMQSICTKCYQTKDTGFSPVRICEGPSKWVGIARLMSTFSSTSSVIESLPSLDAFNILSVKMLSEPSGLPLGLCVFEVASNEEGSKLHAFLLQQHRNAVYVEVNKNTKSPEEEYLSLLFGKEPTNILLVALIPLLKIPDMKFELTLMEMYLLMLLKEDNAVYEHVTLHISKDVGAAYSYGLVTFPNAETADRWLQSRCATFESIAAGTHSPHGTMQRSKISVHFSENNWDCQSCNASNFCLRSLCHGCFKHRSNKLGPISLASKTTNCVALSNLSNFPKTDELIIAEFRKLLKTESGSEFKFKKIEVLRDSECHLIPLACVLEVEDKAQGLQLKEFLASQGQLSKFVVIHKEMNGATVDLSDEPEVMIVDEKPSCIDLTSEDNNFHPTPITPEVVPKAKLLKSVDRPLRPSEYPHDCVISAYPVHRFRDLNLNGLQNYYTSIFRNNGAACEFIQYCGQGLFGVPYDYCLIFFLNPQLAKTWYDKKEGEIRVATNAHTLHYTFQEVRYNRSKLEFSGPNWSCHCGVINCPRRTVCYKCFTQRGSDQIALKYFSLATKYLGVNFFKRNVDILPELKCFISDLVSVRYLSDPALSSKVSSDKYGMYILETKSPEVTSRLFKLYKSKKNSSVSFVMLKNPNAGCIVDLKLEQGHLKEASPDKLIPSDLDDGLESRVMVCPDYETFVWTSSYAFRLNSPLPTCSIMISLCPGDIHLPDGAKAQIRSSLIASGVRFASTTFYHKKDVGSPFSYCLVFFKTVNQAEMWFSKCGGTFEFEVPCPVDKSTRLNFQNCYSQELTTGEKLYFIKSSLHYALRNWVCICGTSNFPLRMVCHKCFQNKIYDSPYVSQSNATEYVGIRLAKFWDESFSVSTFHNLVTLGYTILDVKVCLDSSFPRDPYGIVIIQIPHVDEGIRLHKFLAETIHSYQPKKEQNQDELVEKLRVILNDSPGITFLKCQPPLQSSHNFVRSDNWKSLFNNKTVTEIIAVHPHVEVNDIKCEVPFDRYDGEMKQFKSGVNEQHGFKPTFSFIYFPTPQKAKRWYDANGGILKSNLHESALYFTQDFWTCRSCGVENFPMRVLCHGCYERKLGTSEVDAPLKISNTPTRWVGISRQCDQKEAFVSATSRFQFRSIQVISDPNVRQDGTSVFIFELSTAHEGRTLKDFFAKKNFKFFFFEVLQKENESSTSMTQILPSNSSNSVLEIR